MKKRLNRFLMAFCFLMMTLLTGSNTWAVGADVLILDSTVHNGALSLEAQKAGVLGLTVDIVNAATWGAMTTADFATYKAIILGDPHCRVGTTSITAAENNVNVWGPAVTGNVIVIGTDPEFHGHNGNLGAQALTEKGIDFAASSDPGKTGAYITLSCYYHNTAPLTPVPLLDAFEVGGFTMTGVPGCFNNAHIVATHPSLTGLTDADLSNWGCSVHEAFDSWPISFEVLALALTGTVFTAPDGSVGTPYILARGAEIISDIDLSPDAATNPIGTSHTVTATVDEDGTPQAGVTVDFEIIAGPNATVTGSAITDAAGQATFTYSSSVAGVDTIQATFVDSLGRTQRSDRVTKEWIGLPPILCNAGPDDSVNEANDYTLDGTGSSGGSGSLAFSWSGPFALDDATSMTPTFSAPVVDGNLDTLWTLTLTDDAGQTETCSVIITVIDSDLPPNCDNASADLLTLWPPNHKMVEVGVTGVVDAEDPTTILMITSITQDESTNGLGDGDMSPDGAIDGETARVRAERSGLGDGRVYYLGFEACDSLGQCCTGEVSTGVPHNKKSTPMDSGVSFDSTVE